MSATSKKFSRGLETTNAAQEASDDASTPADSIFFRALDAERLNMTGSMGTSWANLSRPDRMAWRLAQVDIALAGIDGVTEVLHAAESAVCNESETLGENLRDRLFYALKSLAINARDKLEEARQDAERAH